MAAQDRPARVDRARLGAWLLKCNPAAWDLRGFRAAGGDRVTSWSVQPNYRSALMRAGDPVLFWVSGDGRQGFARGIWGLGRVVAEAEPWSEASRGFWHASDGHHGIRARVEVDIALLDQPVTDAELKAAGVRDLEVQRQPFAANPSWLTGEQLRACQELLAVQPEPATEVPR
jgi:predicted RNA-binding protein with PUA-like domain